MNQPNYSIWLLPSETDKLYLSQTIQPLGKKYDAPVFDPHCTLFSPITDPESAKTIIDQCDKTLIQPAIIMMKIYHRTFILLQRRGWNRLDSPVKVSKAWKLLLAARILIFKA